METAEIRIIGECMWEYYERSAPIKVKGGIKAQSKKKEFSASWWGKRWISTLESFHDSARLARGRSYARRGQVLSIDIKSGLVKAKVQGSRQTPYQVTIEFETLSEKSWFLVIDALSKKAIYVARLLAKELPNEIEEIFQEVKINLLPSHHSQLKTDCSCPDWSNPCKHVAAVFYLLAEEFDRNPFLIFEMRGMDRNTFLSYLEKKSLFNQSLINTSENEKKSSLEEKDFLCADPTIFWKQDVLPDSWLQGCFDKPIQPSILVKTLGKFPFWHGEVNLINFLDEAYTKATNYSSQLLQNPEINENEE